ncbi:MAG: hypothetical protein IJQ12_02445 [Lachnospiraceae bacterium]|nr:hypothetical protein [Lachnospiraceae bacterium]
MGLIFGRATCVRCGKKVSTDYGKSFQLTDGGYICKECRELFSSEAPVYYWSYPEFESMLKYKEYSEKMLEPEFRETYSLLQADGSSSAQLDEEHGMFRHYGLLFEMSKVDSFDIQMLRHEVEPYFRYVYSGMNETGFCVGQISYNKYSPPEEQYLIFGTYRWKDQNATQTGENLRRLMGFCHRFGKYSGDEKIRMARAAFLLGDAQNVTVEMLDQIRARLEEQLDAHQMSGRKRFLQYRYDILTKS